MTESAGRKAAFNSDSVPANYQRHLSPPVFEPWATILLDTIGITPGERILDVASGTGVVARMAASRAGRAGRVVASDSSAPMLEYAATIEGEPDSAPIEFVEASATELPMGDGAFDAVLCQQGMPFFPDRPAAAAEMRRVLAPGGRVGVAVWVSGRRLAFEEYWEACIAAGAEPPFPGAFDGTSFTMSEEEVADAMESCGFQEIDVRTVELDVTWPDARAAALGILGTPYGQLVAQLPPEHRAAFDADLERRFAPSAPGEPVRRTTASVVAVAAAP